MSSIRKSFHISIISLCLICPTLANTSYDFIEVGTFNIAELFEGNNPAARDEPVITRMVVSLDLDLIAIQEVGTGKMGESRFQAITSHRNALLAPDAGRCNFITTFIETEDERYTFIWRSPMVVSSALRMMGIAMSPKAPCSSGHPPTASQARVQVS